MNIDFIKLLKLLFPTFMRSGIIGALLTVIGIDLNNIYASFKVWKNNTRLQAAITCQVMYMEDIINYRLFGNFNRTIYITDGDGVTVDFHVNVATGTVVNGQLLISLVEKYKLVGKRYDIVQSTVVYSAEWGNFVCELKEFNYTAQWSDFVCELNIFMVENKATISLSDRIVTVTLESAATSDLAILISTVWDAGATKTDILTLISGQSHVSKTIVKPDMDNIEIISANIVSITPTYDSNYLYTY
jgi:hypothetical protein